MIAYFSDFSQFEIKDVSSKMESTWSNNPKFWLGKKNIYIYVHVNICTYVSAYCIYIAYMLYIRDIKKYICSFLMK